MIDAARARVTNIQPAILKALEESATRPFLERILAGISGSQKLVQFIHRYTVFNGNFADRGETTAAATESDETDRFRKGSKTAYQIVAGST